MKNEKGFSLLEVIIAIALMGIIFVAFLSALSTASMGLMIADERETAKNVAETQMEYVKDQDYAVSYASAPILDEYSGYSVQVTAVSIDPDTGLELPEEDDLGIQKIRIIISHHDKEVTTLEGYKVNR